MFITREGDVNWPSYELTTLDFLLWSKEMLQSELLFELSTKIIISNIQKLFKFLKNI